MTNEELYELLVRIYRTLDGNTTMTPNRSLNVRLGKIQRLVELATLQAFKLMTKTQRKG